MNYKDFQQGDELQQEDIVCMKLTPEETQIALSFLKRRFPKYSIEKIVSTLDHYVYNHQINQHQNRPLQTHPRRNEPIITFPLNQDHRNIEVRQRQRQPQPSMLRPHDIHSQKQQAIKLIAKLFCQSGYDLKKLQTYLPQISAVYYRNYLLSIMNSVLKQVLIIAMRHVDKQLTNNEKYEIKTHMLNAHEWMALKDMKIFGTFLKLIQKKVLEKKCMISQKEVEDLYLLLVSRVRFQCVDMTDIERPVPMFGEEVEKQQLKKQQDRNQRIIQNNHLINERRLITNNRHSISLTQNPREQKLIGQTYLKLKSISQTFSQVKNSLNLQKRSSSYYIQQTLILIIQKCLKQKIQKSIQQKTFGWFELIGRVSSTTAQRIFDYGSMQLKLELIQLQIYGHLNKTVFCHIIQLLNIYFSQHQLYEQEEEQIDEILAHATQFKEEQIYFNMEDKKVEGESERSCNVERRELIDNKEEKVYRQRNERQLYDDKEDKVEKETNIVDENSIQYLIR